MTKYYKSLTKRFASKKKIIQKALKISMSMWGITLQAISKVIKKRQNKQKDKG